MKTTIEIRDDLYRDVKAEAARRGRTVREVTEELYEGWLGRRARPAGEGGRVSEEAIQKWIAEMNALADLVARHDERPGESIVEELRRDRDARG